MGDVTWVAVDNIIFNRILDLWELNIPSRLERAHPEQLLQTDRRRKRMSRSGYSEDCDGWDLIRWRGAVNSALKGKRGQALLKEMALALDSMSVKRLIAGALAKEIAFENDEAVYFGSRSPCFY